MICHHCGAPNSDANNHCVNCGAPLPRPYYGGYPQQPVYQAYPANPAQRIGAKPTVLYIVAGVLAVLGFVMVFLPQFSYTYRGQTSFYNFLGIYEFAQASYRGDMSISTQQSFATFAQLTIFFFLIPLALRVPWAILSFLQKRPAGVFGLLSSIFLFLTDVIWMIVIAVLAASVQNSDYTENIVMTSIPPMVLMLSIAGFVLSIIQLVKKKYL